MKSVVPATFQMAFVFMIFIASPAWAEDDGGVAELNASCADTVLVHRDLLGSDVMREIFDGVVKAIHEGAFVSFSRFGIVGDDRGHFQALYVSDVKQNGRGLPFQDLTVEFHPVDGVGATGKPRWIELRKIGSRIELYKKVSDSREIRMDLLGSDFMREKLEVIGDAIRSGSVVKIRGDFGSLQGVPRAFHLSDVKQRPGSKLYQQILIDFRCDNGSTRIVSLWDIHSKIEVLPTTPPSNELRREFLASEFMRAKLDTVERAIREQALVKVTGYETGSYRGHFTAIHASEVKQNSSSAPYQDIKLEFRATDGTVRVVDLREIGSEIELYRPVARASRED